MKKIISLFQRNYDGDGLVRNELVPGAEWVTEGQGIATQKWDGTCCLVRDGKIYKRYDAKNGKAPPPGFEPAQDPDPVTGHWPGWLLVGDGPADLWHRQAFELATAGNRALDGGTYELCGPKIQSNPEKLAFPTLLPHGGRTLPDCPRDFDGLKAYLSMRDIEGIVWHHPDGRMVKIKGRDFGFKRGALFQQCLS